jgi:hypothetical protein
MPTDSILHNYRRTNLKPHKDLIITHNGICPWDGNGPSLVFDENIRYIITHTAMLNLLGLV